MMKISSFKLKCGLTKGENPMEHSLGKLMFLSLMPLISHVTDEGLREFNFQCYVFGRPRIRHVKLNKEKGI